MKIKATRLITEEAEIETPSWYKKGIKHFFVTEKAIIEITLGQITQWDNHPYGSAYQSSAIEASTGVPITKEEFEAKYCEVINSFDKVMSGDVEETDQKAIVLTEAEKWAGVA